MQVIGVLNIETPALHNWEEWSDMAEETLDERA
jgi:hypothetical protein